MKPGEEDRLEVLLGILTPRSWSEAGGSEPCSTACELLLEPEAEPALTGLLRFHLWGRRTLERGGQPAESPEGDLYEVSFSVPLGDRSTFPFAIGGQQRVEGEITVSCEPAFADRPLLKVTIEVRNLTDLAEPAATREEALRAALVGSRLLLRASGGRVRSLYPEIMLPNQMPVSQAATT